MNPFETLQIDPIRYDLSEETLLHHYHTLMRTFHPDKFLTKAEQEHALIMCGAINTAYEQLKDPVERAAIILKILYGTDISTLTLSSDLLEACLACYDSLSQEVPYQRFLEAQNIFIQTPHQKEKEDAFLIMKYLQKLLIGISNEVQTSS